MANEQPQPKYNTILEWTSPMRVYKKHHRQDFIMVIILALSLIALFFIVRQYMLIAAVIAVVFLTFVMWLVPPDSVKHKLTTVGVYSIDRLYEWDKLKEYWFTKVDDMYMLNISTSLRYPARLLLLIGSAKDADKIHHEIQENLKYRLDLRQNFVDVRLDGKYVPLEENTINPDKLPELDHKALDSKSKGVISKDKK